MKEAFQQLQDELRPTPRRTWLIRTGKTLRFIFILGLALVIAWNMPAIGGTPFAQLTPNDVIVAAICGGLALLCLKWAFNETSDEAAEGWGGWGLLIVACLIGLAFYLSR